MPKMEPDATLSALAAAADIDGIAARVLELPTSDKFRLAAMLLELNRADLAEAIGTRACQEIQLAQLFDLKQWRG